MSYSEVAVSTCDCCKKDFSDKNLYMTPFWYSEDATFVCLECKELILRGYKKTGKTSVQADE